MVRYVTLALASVGFIFAIWSVIDTYRLNKIQIINQKALSILASQIINEKGPCKIEGNGVVVLLNSMENGKIDIAIGSSMKGANND